MFLSTGRARLVSALSYLRSLKRASFNKKFVTSSLVYGNEDVSTSKDLVVTEQLGGVRLIGINRPEKKNCVDTPTALSLLKAFEDFDADPQCNVAVLYGVGGNFCSGFDLGELSRLEDVDLGSVPEDRGPMGPTRFEVGKPVIAAIEGFAVAGGLELACWCDIRIVDETAIMGVFCRRWGVPLIDGGTIRLPQIVGLGRALDIIMTGRKIGAQEAREIGLANQVTGCGAALGRAVFYAEGLENHPQEALRADRNSVRQNAFNHSNLKTALLNEHRNGLRSLKEAKEGAIRFEEREQQDSTSSGTEPKASSKL